MGRDPFTERAVEIEIIELDQRLDMAVDPLAINPLAGWNCANTICPGGGIFCNNGSCC